MKRLVIVPAGVAAVYAQQPAPAPAEQALRDQVTRYYTLVQDKKFREAEKLVAEEAKDDYYNGKKPDIRGFSIQSVKVAPDGQTAVVVVKAKMVAMAFGNPTVFEIPSETHWKMEQNEWRWYPIKTDLLQTPFGVMKAPNSPTVDPKTGGIVPPSAPPDIGKILGGISIDSEAIRIAKGGSAAVTIGNDLEGPVKVSVIIPPDAGLVVKTFDANVPQKSKRTLEFTAGKAKPGTYNATVIVDPFSKTYHVAVTVE